jgi:myosin heavy subunit
MAKTVVALEATINASGAEGSVKSLRAQLKEAQADVQSLSDKFGDTSIQAVNAAKRAAELKDKIGDAKALTDAFNPDQKFKALSSALSVVAGGFSAVQGAMGLFGSDSKELEKTLLKVQSAMALSQGLNSIGEAADAWKKLKASVMEYTIVQKIVTTAQKLWNAAMAANPIGAIVVAITALIAGVVALTSYFMSNAKAAKEQSKSVEDSSKALDKQSKTLERNNSEFQKSQDQKLALAKANGASTKSIRELESKLIEEKIAFELASRATAQNTYEKEKNKLASLKAADADEELIKKQLDNVKKAVEEFNTQNKNVQSAYDERTAINRKHIVEVAQENTDASNKAAEKRKQDNEQAIQKQKEHNKEILEADQQLQQQRRTIAQQQALDNIKDEDDKAKKKLEFDFLNSKKEIENSKASIIEKNATLQLLYTQYIDNLNAVDEARKKKTNDDADAELAKMVAEVEATTAINADKLLKESANDELSFQERLAKIIEREQLEKDIKFTSEEEKTKFEKENSDARIQIAKEEANAKTEAANAVASSIEMAAGLIGKQTAVGKAMAIAATTINTYTAAMEAYKRGLEIPYVGMVLGPLNAGLAIATGIANVKKILSVQTPGGGGGGGGSVPSAVNIPNAPVQPQVSTTTINQGQVNQLASATSRAFVLESDVSGNQERIQRLNRAARIN